MTPTREVLEPAPLWNRWVARAIDLLVGAVSDSQKRLGDRMAGTAVVEAD